MADRSMRVTLVPFFLQRLDALDAYWTDCGSPKRYDELLALLEETVIPNLRRFPRLGRPYLDSPPASAEAMTTLGHLPAGSAEALRVLVVDDYLILYLHDAERAMVRLLSIRHHRQLGFDLPRAWG